MIICGVAEPPYTAAEVDAAVDALREPERLAHAQEVVTHAAPSLQRVLAESLAAGGWFDQAHESEVARRRSGRTPRSARARCGRSWPRRRASECSSASRSASSSPTSWPARVATARVRRGGAGDPPATMPSITGGA